MSTRTTKAKTKAMTAAQEKAVAAMMAEDVGAGTEDFDSDSVAIPFLRILQKGSPQCDEAASGFLEDARPGMFYNSVTNELFDGKEGVVLLPCGFQRRFLRFAPRGDGSLSGVYTPEEVVSLRESGSAVEHEGRLYIPEAGGGQINVKRDDRLVDSRSHFCLLLSGDSAEKVVFSLASTQIKKSKQLNAMLSKVRIAGAPPPTWMNRVKATTVPEQNDEGSWHGVKFELDGFIEDQALYAEGKAFHDSVSSGAASYASEPEAEETAEEQF